MVVKVGLCLLLQLLEGGLDVFTQFEHHTLKVFPLGPNRVMYQALRLLQAVHSLPVYVVVDFGFEELGALSRCGFVALKQELVA